jgi:hypothetical protein
LKYSFAADTASFQWSSSGFSSSALSGLIGRGVFRTERFFGGNRRAKGTHIGMQKGPTRVQEFTSAADPSGRAV